jgi:hypothetical protein
LNVIVCNLVCSEVGTMRTYWDANKIVFHYSFLGLVPNWMILNTAQELAQNVRFLDDSQSVSVKLAFLSLYVGICSMDFSVSVIQNHGFG